MITAPFTDCVVDTQTLPDCQAGVTLPPRLCQLDTMTLNAAIRRQMNLSAALLCQEMYSKPPPSPDLTPRFIRKGCQDYFGYNYYFYQEILIPVLKF